MDRNESISQTEKKWSIEDVIRFFKPAILAVAVTVFLMNFVFINAYVPTGSMENTIMAGSRIFGMRLLHDYRRGDIVIFPDPDGSRQYLVKRIIGMPSDMLEIRDGEVFSNGSLLEEHYLKETMEPEEDFSLLLPKDGYFVMGDNRNDSYDARYWDNQIVYGKNMVGIVLLRYWPITEIKFLR